MSENTVQLSDANLDSEFIQFMDFIKREARIRLKEQENEINEKVKKAKAELERESKRAEEARLNIARSLDILDGFSQFELGRFLLKNGSLDAFWTSYVVHHPYQKEHRLCEWEDWVLNRSILSKAIQERYVHFKNLIQSHLKDHSRIASFPSGLMDDFLELDLTQYSNLELHAIDTDQRSLEIAEERFKKLGVNHRFIPTHSDAWSYENPNHLNLDVIVNNGLSIYEPREERLKELFEKFYRMLKPGGVLITSTLRPYYQWDVTEEEIDLEAKVAELVIRSNSVFDGFGDGRDVKHVFEILMRAGFSDLKYINDSKNVLSTIRAVKC